MKRVVGCYLMGLLAFAGCDDPDSGKKLMEATPATGSNLESYSRNITRSVQLGRDGSLVQLFCKNTTGGACAADIVEKLKAYGFVDNLTGVDLANAFAMMAADAKDGTADQSSSDEDFLAAAYRVALGREPDQDGAQVNLKFIGDNGERKAMLRSLLELQEFKSLAK